MEEEKLISEIRSLFIQLKEEEKGQYICNFTKKLVPDGKAIYSVSQTVDI